MDSTIIASLISAAASIVVALISRGNTPGRAPGRTAIPKRNQALRIYQSVLLLQEQEFLQEV